MPVSSTVLVESLRGIGLLAAERLAVVVELSAALREAQALATELVGRGWLTTYQADELVAGQGEGLVAGPYAFYWSRWVRAAWGRSFEPATGFCSGWWH